MPQTIEHFIQQEDDYHRCRIELVLRPFFGVNETTIEEPGQKEWNVEEDQFIVNCSNAHEDDWVKEYNDHSRVNPQLFPKKNITTRTLEIRLETLRRHLPWRYKLLKAEADNSQQHTYQPLFDVVPKRRRSKPVIDSEIVFHCDDGEVAVSSAVLLKLSKRINVMLSNKPVSIDNKHHLNFSSEEFSMKTTDTHEAFTVKSIKNFLKICQQPSWSDTKLKLENSIKLLLNDNKDLWNTLKLSNVEKRTTAVNQIKDALQQTLYDVEERSKICLKNDIEALTVNYERNLRKEIKTINKKYNQLASDVDMYYDAEDERVSNLALTHNTRARELLKYEEQINTLDGLLSDLHGSNADPCCIPRMFILSDVLESDVIKDTIIELILEKPVLYFETGIFESRLLQSTGISYLLSRMSSAQIYSLESAAINGTCEKLISKELAFRISVAKSEYREMDTEQLTLLAKSLPFDEDLILLELSSRAREGFNLKKKSSNVVSFRHVGDSICSQSDKSLTVAISGSYVTALGTHGRSFTDVGVWFWEATINEKDPGTTVCFGWESVTSSSCTLTSDVIRQIPCRGKGLYGNQKIPGLTPGENGLHGLTVTSDGVLHTFGHPEDTFELFSKNDVIGLSLNQLRGSCSFYKNGHPITKATDIELDSPSCFHVVPCITFYTCVPHQRLVVTPDFYGPFKYPILNHTPYAMFSV